MIKAITGTKDILPVDMPKWHALEETVRNVFSNFNYKEIRTPIFEETALFARGIGESTDIVSKEMYTFIDRSETSVTLRPEMTASVVRSVIEHSLHKQQGLNKLYYFGPMFRQERPQAGRFRQFHQFGAEGIGSNDPALDAEMIIMAYDIITKLGLKNLTVKINSLGLPESREEYKKLLREYLSDKVELLSEESRKRYETNVMRIFDSKAENDQKIMAEAPLLIEHLDEESLEHFKLVKEILTSANVIFEVDPKLVRGLDYYTHTAFEIVSTSVGSQSALCGGGRYNLLSKEIGGEEIPGVGFAAGMERILLACENEKSFEPKEYESDLYIARLDKSLYNVVIDNAIKIRRNNLIVEYDYNHRSFKAQMREANKINSRFVMIVGGEEYERGETVLKDMSNGEQFTFKIDATTDIIKKITG
ncbi:MAG: histidine--tRNA ligase [Bacteroidetes bacterium]|nr:histidine--tRNA ligase [Bacteroidota bacterium]